MAPFFPSSQASSRHPTLPYPVLTRNPAQLGPLKLNCNRSFVSLIDNSHQYIIGEATKSTSLLLDDIHAPSTSNDMQDEDGIYLGFRSLELNFGVCPQTIQIFTSQANSISTPNISANSTRYVIRDFQADPHFSTRPYVTGFPHMRSYAEVPLTSDAGFVIGSYCVVDDKPRDFDDAEIAILSGISECIMDHLELLKGKLEFGRVEGLVRGIGSYVAGYSGLKEQQTRVLPSRAVASSAQPAEQEEPTRDEKHESGKTPPRPETSSLQPQELPALASSSNSASDPSSGAASMQLSSDATSTKTSVNESFGYNRPLSQATTAQKQQEDGQGNNMESISRDVRTAFSRAGNLIRQSMEMQGVAFLVRAPTL